MSAPIFISYSSKDQKMAGTIAQALEARGQRCWIASRDVRAGDNFQEAIVRALRDSKVMLLVFSANANNSDEIKKELVLAGRHRVTVVPVRVEDVVPNDAFSYELATRQWVDLFQDWETQIEQLVAQVEMILAAPGEAPPPPRPMPMPPEKKKSSNVALMAGLAVLVLLIMGGALAWWKMQTATITQAMTQSVTPPPAAPAPVAAAPVQSAAPPVTSAPPQNTATAAPAMKGPAVKSPAMMAMTAKRKSDAPAAAADAAKPVEKVAVAAPPPAAPVAAPAPATPPPENPDEAAWASASRAGTRDGYNEYVRNFASGAHFGEAQLALANMILATPATGTAFDGNWQTTWTCANLGQYPGYSYRYEGTIRNGVYHGSRGEKGTPSSMVLDGRVDADGIAAFYGEVVVGSSMQGMGVSRGTPSDFHALAHFDGANGNGKRLEGRGCILTFAKG